MLHTVAHGESVHWSRLLVGFYKVRYTDLNRERE